MSSWQVMAANRKYRHRLYVIAGKLKEGKREKLIWFTQTL